MSATWLSIRVELVSGHGKDYWPRPGRIFAAARATPFVQLAQAIDDAFARWDRAHLHQFYLRDGARVAEPDPEWDEPDDANRIDPLEVFGLLPPRPVPYWGWGEIPDQYGRKWDYNNDEPAPPPDPRGADLPAIGPWEQPHFRLAPDGH